MVHSFTEACRLKESGQQYNKPINAVHNIFSFLKRAREKRKPLCGNIELHTADREIKGSINAILNIHQGICCVFCMKLFAVCSQRIQMYGFFMLQDS